MGDTTQGQFIGRLTTRDGEELEKRRTDIVNAGVVLDGASRTDAARAAGMERQTLRDWVIRYNEEGIDGLCDRPRSGRPGRLSPTRFAVTLSERQVERILKRLKFTRLSVRPRHPQADEAAQQAFKKTSPHW